MDTFDRVLKKTISQVARVAAGFFTLAASLCFSPLARGEVDLLARYPTRLTGGDTVPFHARPWQFTEADIFSITGFTNHSATNLTVQTGLADLGIGHCADGAVWALVVPREPGTLCNGASPQPEAIAHVWMRFHPALLNKLFPPATVSAPDSTNAVSLMRLIAAHKFHSSFHADTNALIPKPGDLIIDADTTNRVRRFFIVDREARASGYVAAFEDQAFHPPPPLTPALAEAAFDQLWDAFDSTYAGFVLRPEIDWDKLRNEWRPRALACQTSEDFAAACASMLRPLRDLHVSLTLAGSDIPVFNRPRVPNANPAAHKKILGNLHVTGRVQSGITTNNIGFIAIYGWDDPAIPQQFDAALETMRQTRGLIVDVRWNGGGSEGLAQKVAGRFLAGPTIYGYDQFRDGPARTSLTKRFSRSVSPCGPWRYDKPVILLIGQKCMSSCESFVGMMMGATNVTTMGDHTCGSSGNPQIVELPLEMTVGVPRWIDYLPDGSPLDEHGFQPRIAFTPSAESFNGSRDDLLSAALSRLSPNP